ncbi:hypothetical protein ABTX62_15010 [Streptomyces sp. NPDC096046]|uniref:hypothetical protein n=1 Tax=Streptomyces sp. NPDC096046 TaxID=3155542 RepID=UPI003316968C
MTFGNWTSGDPDEQAVLNDGREQLRAGYSAIIADEPDGGEALVFYDTKAGLAADREWIKSYTDKNVTVIGELPVFDPQATLFVRNTKARLGHCHGREQGADQEPRDERGGGNRPGADPHVAYVVTMQKSEQGVWQTVPTNSGRAGCS